MITACSLLFFDDACTVKQSLYKLWEKFKDGVGRLSGLGWLKMVEHPQQSTQLSCPTISPTLYNKICSVISFVKREWKSGEQSCGCRSRENGVDTKRLGEELMSLNVEIISIFSEPSLQCASNLNKFKEGSTTSRVNNSLNEYMLCYQFGFFVH